MSELTFHTLGEAKAWLREAVESRGAKCPCCRQFAKIYKRRITSSMAYALILVERYFRTTPDAAEWLHVPSMLTSMGLNGGGDWAKLTHWDLLEEKPDIRDDDSPRAGYYKITPLGVEFVHNRVRVKKFVFIYSGERLSRTTDATVSIEEALTTRFNYRDLMENYSGEGEQ